MGVPTIRRIPSSVHTRLGRSAELTFTNLMEARFIDAFVQLGVHVRTIRAILDEARNVVRHPHPFATDTVGS